MAKYISLNGEILLSEKACISHDNRGLIFGDSFSFELRGNSSKAFFGDEYFQYFIESVKLLGYQRSILHRRSSLITDLELLLQKNRIYKGFKARFTIFRNDLETNTCSILISVEALSAEYYTFLQEGFKILVNNDIFIPEHRFNFDITAKFNEELFLFSKLETNNINDFLLCDNSGCIVKSLNSSVFFVKNENLILPSRHLNNSSQIFVKIVASFAKDSNIPVVYWDVKEKDLYDLDEIFLGDIVNGLRKVTAFKNKRYFYKLSESLSKSINFYLGKV